MSSNVCLTKLRGYVFAFILFSFTLVNRNAHASDFFIDPSSGSPSGDGSEARPWQTLENAINSGQFSDTVREGDTVWLKSGYHGEFIVNGEAYSTSITVAAAADETPEVSLMNFSNASGWIVKGLSISPSYGSSSGGDYMVSVNESSSNIVIENCELFSVRDVTNWSAGEWINTASSGITVKGDHVTLRNNKINNVRFGISVVGTNALVEHNTIDSFSADGIRVLGDHGVYQYNTVKNVYVSSDAGDDNHDDGFQSWSTGPDGPGSGVVSDIVLRGNVVLNRTDPNQPLQNRMQGIGCFDGFFDNWIVENNVVATNHWHGISFYGMRNSRIVNNTVIDIDGEQPGPPWIMVNDHKDGRRSQNVVVRNNLATDFDVSGDDVVQDHNTTLGDLASYFVDWSTFDLHLLPNSPAVDTGSAEQAPELDADRIPRPQGDGVDLGAYEWHDESVTPQDGGVETGGTSGTESGGTSGTESGGTSGTESGGTSGTDSQGDTGGTTSAGDSGSGDQNGGSSSQRDGTGGVRSEDTGGRSGSRVDAGVSEETDSGTEDSDANSSNDTSVSGGCSCELAEKRPTSSGWIVLAMVLVGLRIRFARAARS